MNISFIKETILFFLAVFFAFYLPGFSLIKILKIDLDNKRKHFLSLIVGFTAFSFIFYIFSLLNLRVLLYPLLAFFCLFGMKELIFLFKLKQRFFGKIDIRMSLFFLVTILFFSLSMLRSGWQDAAGLQFVDANWGDGIWNLAIIEELIHEFPPQHPAFSGVPLRGYHILYSLVLAAISSVFKISTVHLYFHFFPILIAFFWTVGVYILVKEIAKKRAAAIWAVFFSVFGGSFVFLFPNVWRRGLSLDDAFGIQQPIAALLNPTFASSIAILIVALFCFFKYFEKKRIGWLFVFSFFAGLSVGFKIYAGIIALGALLVVSLWRFVFQKNIDLIVSFAFSLILALFVFLPLNVNYGFLVLFPLWPLRQLMMGTLSFTDWELKRLTYQSTGSFFHLAKLWIEAFFIFFLGNLGMRILAFLGIIRIFLKKGALFKPFNLFFFGCLAVSFLVPLFFIQPAGGVFNMIQMYWYFLFFISIWTGISFAILLEKTKSWARVILIIFILILTLPSALFRLKGFAFAKAFFLDSEQLNSFKFLKSYPDYGLTTLEIPDLSTYDFGSLDSWFSVSSRPYVPALAGKRAYLENEIASFEYKDKERRLEVIVEFMHPDKVCNKKGKEKFCQQFLKASRKIIDREEIAFILAPTRINWIGRMEQVEQVYQNPKITIYLKKNDLL